MGQYCGMGSGHEEYIDYLRVAICSLRQKLEAGAANPTLIVN